MKKGIAAILLCMQIISTGTVFAIPKNVRQAGILDVYDSMTKTYSYENIVCNNVKHRILFAACNIYFER